MIKKIKEYKVKSFSRISGKLTPLNFDKDFPINVKRIFFIYGKSNKIRGDHAHKKCSQLFFIIKGKIILSIKTPKISKNILLSDKSKKAILIPPKYWCSIKFINNNSIVMVACDQYYKYSDYLESFDDYKKYLKKK